MTRNPVWAMMLYCDEGISCQKHIALSQEIAEEYGLPTFVTKEEFIKAGGVIDYGL